MKSRTSCFNMTVFKKNLTRFAPCWGLYTVGAILGLIYVMTVSGDARASDLLSSLVVLSLITPIYAITCALLIFGDLYDSRACNALHALPMTRDCWFTTNVISGFVFHLIPTAVMALLAVLTMAISCPASCLPAAPLWFLGVNLQFLCFFGIAVLCAFCVGSRFALGLVYGIVNFVAVLAAWMVDTLYMSMFYGIQLNYDPFFLFSPVANMIEHRFVYCNYPYHPALERNVRCTYELGEGFAYYFIVAAIGCGLLMLALKLYRRRNLECAGDFMALRGLKPVFLVIYSLFVDAAFCFVTGELLGMESMIFIFIGLAIGWFTGKMLLEKTPKVFRIRNILYCGALMGVLALTLAVAALDPAGLVRWVPSADDVKSVSLADGWYTPMHLSERFSIDDPEEIQMVIDLHQGAINFYEEYGTSPFYVTMEEAYGSDEETKEDEQFDWCMSWTFTYHLKNGRTVSRNYEIWMGDGNGEILSRLFGGQEALFGAELSEEEFLARNEYITIANNWTGEDIKVHSREDIRQLYRAMIADCEAGTMIQMWEFHRQDATPYWIGIGNGWDLMVFSNCENTLNWLREYGLDVDGLLKEMGY